MPTQGPFLPTAASGTGWSGPGNIEGNSAFASSLVLAGATSNNIFGSAYGFSIPAGSTINGIQASITRKQTGSGTLETNLIQLTKVAGTGVGTGKGNSTVWTTTATVENYGSVSDLWGTTWTPSEINGSGFGFLMNALESGGVNQANAFVQNFTITVTYTVPAGEVSCQALFGF